MKKSIITAAFVIFTSIGISLAHNHGGVDHSGHTAPTAKTPAAKAFTDANAKMHKDMTIPFTGNAEHDFVRGMIPHHQGAIDMAEIILKYGKNAEARTLAQTIIKAQKVEIAEMQVWLSKNPSPIASPDATAINSAYALVNAKMHKDMTMKFSDNADKDFLTGMIPHHEGAVGMAKILQQYGKDAELLKLASNIIQSQNLEITQMRAFLAKL